MDENDFYELLGKRIKFLRENARLTQEKLAKKPELVWIIWVKSK